MDALNVDVPLPFPPPLLEPASAPMTPAMTPNATMGITCVGLRYHGLLGATIDAAYTLSSRNPTPPP